MNGNAIAAANFVTFKRQVMFLRTAISARILARATRNAANLLTMEWWVRNIAVVGATGGVA